MIDNVVCFKSKILENVDFPLASPGKVIQLLKVKSKEKRVSRERFKFPADLSGFSERTIYRARRPITGESSGAQRRTSERQTIIDNSEEEKKEEHIAEQLNSAQ